MSTTPALKNTLSANERLKSRKLLDSLFEEGKALVAAPFRLVFKEVEFDTIYPVKIAFSAPKRRMKLAHDRNRSKRSMREGYRKNKHALVDWCRKEQKSFALLLIAQSNTPAVYSVTEEKIILLLNRLILTHEKAAQ